MKQLLVPVEAQTSVKVASSFDSCNTRHNSFRWTFDKSSKVPVVHAVEPLLILPRHVDGAIERFGPLQVRGVEVRMADDDSLQAAFGVDL